VPSLRRLTRRLVTRAARAKINTRGALAAAGIVAVAMGLSELATWLAWVAVGAFLIIAAGAPAVRGRE